MPSECGSACTITRSRSGDGDISEADLERCRMGRARAAKVALAQRSCARSSIKPRGHRGVGPMDLPRDGPRVGGLQGDRATGLE